MPYRKIEKQFNAILEKFIQNGLSSKEAISFIQNNFYFLLHHDVFNHLYFCYNHDHIYAVMIMLGEDCYWSVFQDHLFYPLEKREQDHQDYVIEMMLNFTNNQKLSYVIPDIQKMDVENKVKVLSRKKLNSYGYHFK